MHKSGEYESEYCYFLINEDDKTQSNYEKIVGHEETLQSTHQVTSPFVNQRGTSDYSEAYEDLDEAEGELSDSLYHFVPSSVQQTLVVKYTLVDLTSSFYSL